MILRAAPITLGEPGSIYQAMLTFDSAEAASAADTRATLTFIHAEHDPIELVGRSEAVLIQTARQVYAAAVSLAQTVSNRVIHNAAN